jgi:antitoxin StbD
MELILADATISITELKRNPSAVIEAAGDESVAVLVHNKPSAYLVPAATYKRLLERLEDLELAELARARAKERRIKVKLDEL